MSFWHFELRKHLWCSIAFVVLGLRVLFILRQISCYNFFFPISHFVYCSAFFYYQLFCYLCQCLPQLFRGSKGMPDWIIMEIATVEKCMTDDHAHAFKIDMTNWRIGQSIHLGFQTSSFFTMGSQSVFRLHFLEIHIHTYMFPTDIETIKITMN